MNNDFNNEFNNETNNGFENTVPQTPAPEEKPPKYAADFRRAARGALSGKWGIAVAAYLLYTVVTFACLLPMYIAVIPVSIASSLNGGEMAPAAIAVMLACYLLALIAAIVVSPALSVGYYRFNLELYGEGDAQIKSLFFGFKNCFGKAFKATLLIALRVLLCIAVMSVGIIPGAIMIAMETPLLTFLGVLLMVIGYVMGLILIFVIAFKYVLVPMVLADDPTLSAREAVRRSAELMKGNVIRYICLNLSFIGWYLLAACCCSFGTVVLTPYMSAASTSFYLAIKREKGETEAPKAGPQTLDDYFIVE
jgi:uncharacterized membrane protein